MRRPSALTFGAVSVLLALSLNLATNTIQVDKPWWPYAVWSATIALAMLAIAVEVHRNRASDDTGTATDRRKERHWVFVSAGLAVTTVLAIAALVVATDDQGATTKPPDVWPGRIGNTWSQSRNAYVGTFAFAGPDTSQRVGAGYPEGTEVKVVCFRSGRTITDPTLRTSSDVWYKLSDGNWISKLYFVPDPASDKSAGSIPRCD